MKNNMLVHQGYRYYTYIQIIKDEGKNKKTKSMKLTKVLSRLQDGFHRYILFIVEGWVFAPLHHHQQIFSSSPSPKMLIQTKLWNMKHHHHNYHFKFLKVHTRTRKGKTSGNLE
jgi:hypothetical protein